MTRIAILGAGAWGTALARLHARHGREVRLWSRDPGQAAAIGATGRNPRYLRDVELGASVEATADLGHAVEGADLVLVVVPAQATRAVLSLLPTVAAPLVLCAKGLEAGTGRTQAEIAAELRPDHPLAVLSGPTFAAEVAAGLPTAVVVAASAPALARSVAERLAAPSLRTYWTDDVAGVEIGGTVKNVLAIAAGAVIGAGLGENARAALLTRGLAELMRIGAAIGARAETLTGLSGLGDLLLTATSARSRNTAFGMALGRGETVESALAASAGVVEGALTVAAVAALARRHSVEAPVVASVDRVVNQGAAVPDEVQALLARPLKAEHGGRDA